MRDAVPIVLHHHERYDGTGYPHGLRGEEIPLGARIVAVADAYHAMVHDRPYKSALSHVQALAELRRHASTQFDPTVVEVFSAIFGDEVPSDGQEEVQRLHAHAHGGLEVIDPRAAALLNADAAPAVPADPAPADTNGTGPNRRRRETPSTVTDTTGVESPLRPAEQAS
jgi:hypothetical protein